MRRTPRRPTARHSVLAAGAEFPSFRLYAGHHVVWERTLLEMLGSGAIERRPDAPYPLPWLLPQWRTDEILYERLVAPCPNRRR
jgi:hypothetical protein